MKFLKDIKFEKIMVVTMVVAIAVLILNVIVFYSAIGESYDRDSGNVLNGYIDISDRNITESAPVELIGEWNYYPGVYIYDDIVDYNLLHTENQYIGVPIKDLSEAGGTATYKIKIKLDITQGEIDDIVVSIPFATEETRVFINGSYVSGSLSEKDWYGFSTETCNYAFSEHYKPNLEYQEILISVNEDAQNTDLYNRIVSIAHKESIVAIEKLSYMLQSILLGMMITSMVVGVLYIVMLPTYSTLTFLNLFDIVLMAHIFFNLTDIPLILLSILPSAMRDYIIRGIDLGSLFGAFYVGNILTGFLFDPEKKAPKIFRTPMNLMYLVLVVVFAIYPKSLTQTTLISVLLVMSLSAVGLVSRFLVVFKAKKFDKYTTLHFIKSLFLIVISGIDCLTINLTTRPESIILLGYMLFFIVHLVARVFEHRISYLDVERVNKNLEEIVEERTRRLTEANEVLKNLSVQDALTKAYNRLFFEEKLHGIFRDIKEGTCDIICMHMCVFDLDNFKSINDTYGHAVGDEQLIETVQLLKLVVDEDVPVCRIGGEEFALLFIDYEDKRVLEVVEDARVALEKLSIKDGRTTGSFGVAKYYEGDVAKDLFTRTDDCLYNAKENGKNHIVYDFDKTMQRYEHTTV